MTDPEQSHIPDSAICANCGWPYGKHSAEVGATRCPVMRGGKRVAWEEESEFEELTIHHYV